MHGKAPAWVGSVGTVLYLVRAASAHAAREKVAEQAEKRCRQKGLLFSADEVSVRPATAADLLVFAEVAPAPIDHPELVA